eukprot:1979052-Rhodomonas_salina.1
MCIRDSSPSPPPHSPVGRRRSLRSAALSPSKLSGSYAYPCPYPRLDCTHTLVSTGHTRRQYGSYAYPCPYPQLDCTHTHVSAGHTRIPARIPCSTVHTHASVR